MSTNVYDGGYGGAGVGGNASAFSNVENDIQITDQAYVTGTSQYGSAISQGEGSSLNYSESDQGAIAAGLSLGQAGILSASTSAQKAVDAGLLAISRASDIVETKAESDITKVAKPLIWLAVLVAVVLLGWKFLSRGK